MYQALYRKYRPRTFDDVWGQEHITEALKAQVAAGRTSHAYLFVGTRGTGKTTCAKLLARAVNCEHPVNGSPCNECPACRGIESGQIMDVVEIDAASNTGVDNIRTLRDEAVFAPAAVKKRVYIVDEVHMLSGAAFNALLKILEEPPEHLMFILATTELRKVPATILSRCQRFSFRRLDAEVITQRLKYVAEREGIKLTDGAADMLARLADGGMRDALSLLDQCSGRELVDEQAVLDATGSAGQERITALLDAVAGADTGAALDLFSALWTDGKDAAGVLSDLSALIRDTLLLSVAPKGAGALLSGAYSGDVLSRFAARFTREELISALNALQGGISAMRDSPSPRTVAELTLIRLSDSSLSADSAGLAARVSRLEAELATLRSGGASLPSAAREPAAERVAPPEAKPPEPAKAAPAQSRPASEEPDAPPPWTDEDAPPEEGGYAGQRPARPAPEPAGAGSEPVRAEGGLSWERLVAAARPRLPASVKHVFGTAAFAGGEIAGDELVITTRSSLSYNMLNNPSCLDILRQTASELAGRPITLRLQSGEDDGSARRTLDELRQFEIVKFTGKGGNNHG